MSVYYYFHRWSFPKLLGCIRLDSLEESLLSRFNQYSSAYMPGHSKFKKILGLLNLPILLFKSKSCYINDKKVFQFPYVGQRISKFDVSTS